jgi:7-cyano-7-deazaguanine reductase
MTDKLTDIAKKTLGDSTSYAVYTDKFDPSLLNPMPRSIAREGHGIMGIEFKGFDVWHCHEATFLLDNGLPVAGTLKFVYDAESEYMIESKSMKLYLNSFDMCKMGKTAREAILNYETQVKSDLEKVLGTQVSARFYSSYDYKSAHTINLFHEYEDLSACSGAEFFDGVSSIRQEFLENMVIDDYEGKKSHLEVVEIGRGAQHKYFSNILRSRCRHTKQKDTGTALIAYSSTKLIAPPSLLKQIVSLREVNEFHEFCAEKLFCEIAKNLNPTDPLNVTLLYARRGSLDINPVRFRGSQSHDMNHFVNPGILSYKAQGQ